jgi:hypothetical protein
LKKKLRERRKKERKKGKRLKEEIDMIVLNYM